MKRLLSSTGYHEDAPVCSLFPVLLGRVACVAGPLDFTKPPEMHILQTIAGVGLFL
jgi:hypothetical protein